jgi:hypothetical protein
VSAHSCALRQPVNSVTHASTTPRHVCVHNTVHIWRTRRIPADPHANADTFISDDADAHALVLMHAPLDAHKVRSRRVRTAHAQAPTCPTHRTSHPTNQSNYARVRMQSQSPTRSPHAARSTHARTHTRTLTSGTCCRVRRRRARCTAPTRTLTPPTRHSTTRHSTEHCTRARTCEARHRYDTGRLLVGVYATLPKATQISRTHSMYVHTHARTHSPVRRVDARARRASEQRLRLR